MKNNIFIIILYCLFLVNFKLVSAQPEPGDFFKEYVWITPDGDGEYANWHYHYFRGEIKNHVGSSDKRPFNATWDISWLPDQNDPVSISEEIYKSTPHFKVKTAKTTWYIEKQSGGCSSMIDSNGNDWINFKKTGNKGPTNSADSDFRGLPNMVYREPGNGVGHPGFDQCTVDKVSENELLVQSKDNNWQFRWAFHPDYAEIIVEKTDTLRNYWFLYEGTPGGNFNPESNYWGNNADGLRADQPSIYSDPAGGNWRWVFFGDEKVNTTLFVATKGKDYRPDYFAYMGNSSEKGNLSDDGMIVFGFGRGLKTSPLLSGQNHFFVGFFPEKINNNKSVKKLGQYIGKIINNK